MIDDSELDSLPVVITHDCDLLNSKEEFIEVIVGKKNRKTEFRRQIRKNPRCLHLRFTSSADEKPVYLELRFSNRESVSKDYFFSCDKLQHLTGEPMLMKLFGSKAVPDALTLGNWLRRVGDSRRCDLPSFSETERNAPQSRWHAKSHVLSHEFLFQIQPVNDLTLLPK